MIVSPFRGLRPRADLAARIPSLPYDVVDAREARELAANDPYTFLHVVKAEVDLDPGIDPHDDRVYAKARENFTAMRTRGWLARDPRAAFYVYRLRLGGHVQTGIVGAASVDDYLEGRIKRHEHTRPDKEDDRVRHAEAISAHAGPVFLAYRDDPATDAIVAEAVREDPAADFEARDGVGHALWVVDQPSHVTRLAAAFCDIPATYIADGHHRAAAYARVSQSRLALRIPGDESCRRFLAVHFPASQLRILDYNRLVRDTVGLGPAGLLTGAQDAGFDVINPWPAKRPPRPGSFGVYLEGEWRLMVARPGTIPEGDPVGRQDAAVLQDRVLGPLYAIGDPRTDERIAFEGGIRGVDELERRVDAGEFSAAFSLYPTRLEDVMRVADAGGVMPPKSTWFEPKLRSGVVVHLLDADGA
jgi:uncharacterized protein (DUF1015 family)